MWLHTLKQKHMMCLQQFQLTSFIQASLVAQTVKNLPAMQETWIQSLSREDPREKGMAIHSSILAWRIPWTEEERFCALCLGANFNFPSFGKQNISNSLVGC